MHRARWWMAAVVVVSVSVGAAELVYTDKPSLDQAPAEGMKASLDGNDVAINQVTLSLEKGQVAITIGNLDSGNDPGLRISGLKGKLAKGTKFETTTDDTWAALPGKSGVRSWNGPLVSLVAELTDVSVKPCTKATEGKVIGTASGRVVAMLRGVEPIKPSWLAGTFKNATVKCEKK